MSHSPIDTANPPECWGATTGAPPRNGNAVESLIDNQAAWAAILKGVRGAQTSINFMLFYLDVADAAMTLTGDRLELALADAAVRGVKVRLLLNDMSFAPYPFDTAEQVNRFFDETVLLYYPGQDRPKVTEQLAKNLDRRTFRYGGFPPTPVHAKVVIVDDATAYIIGSPFVQDYFDAPTHALSFPSRGRRRMSKACKSPVHDVSLVVRGPVVADIHETFRLHWNEGHPEPSALPPIPAPPPAGNLTTRAVRSLGGNKVFGSAPHGETSIYVAYLNRIAKATTYIYLENQYFTEQGIVDALVAAVKNNQRLEVVLVTNLRVDIPGYNKWQPYAIMRLRNLLTKTELKRVGIYTLWTSDKVDNRLRVGRIYVHSKVAVIDDDWTTVGSANLDGVSLVAGEHALRMPVLKEEQAMVRLYLAVPGGNVPEEIRSTEANLLVLEAEAPAAGRFASDLRSRLWAEHLGVDAAALPAVSGGGLVDYWNASAAATAAAFTKGDPSLGRVLPFPERADQTSDERALTYLKIYQPEAPNLTVAPEFDFERPNPIR